MNWPEFRDRLKIHRQKLSRSAFVQGLATWVLAQYIRLVYRTSRRRFEIPEASQPYRDGEESCIFAFWHGRLMMIPPYKPPHRPMHVMISHHNDGELIAQTVARFGIGTIRGSSSKGGMLAGRDVIKLARQGDNISITPDGPRGPNRQVQEGIILLARLSGKPIIPVSYSTSRHKALKSWDRMQIPLPFGRLAACVGEPITVAKGGEEAIEQARLRLEEELNRLTSRADMLVGISEEHSARSATQRKATRR